MTEIRFTAEHIAGMIDHSLLQPQMTRADIEEGCRIAEQYKTASVCVRGYDTAYCAKRLAGTGVKVASVVGFPHGNSSIDVKVFETNRCIEDGADEIDLVLPIGILRSGDLDYVEKELAEVLEACRANSVLLKVIFENSYLTDKEIIQCCEISSRVGVDFVKTSTGYAPVGATEEHIRLMRANTPEHIEIKAAGGIRTLDDFLRFYQAGATRQGTRSTVEIVEEAQRRLRTGDDL